MTEAEFQAAVIDLAHATGWRVAHFRPARTEQGWRTPVTADGAGFPDLVLVHERRGEVRFWECKTDVGRLSVPQQDWLTALLAAGVRAEVVRPRYWAHVVEVLTGRPARIDGEAPHGPLSVDRGVSGTSGPSLK